MIFDFDFKIKMSLVILILTWNHTTMILPNLIPNIDYTAVCNQAKQSTSDLVGDHSSV